MSLHSLENNAALQPFLIAQPAAGADFSMTIPAAEFWRLETAFLQFNTSAVVGNRFVKLQITDGTNPVWEGGGQAAIAASSGYRLGLQRMGGQAAASGPGVPNLGALPDVWLPPGYVFRSLTSLIDVGDQYLAVRGLAWVSSSLV